MKNRIHIHPHNPPAPPTPDPLWCPLQDAECRLAAGLPKRDAIETMLCHIAASLPQSAELTTDEILTVLREAEMLDDVLRSDCRDERKALGFKLRKLRGCVFTDTRGRGFEFGRRNAASGCRHAVQFLNA